MAFWPRPGKSTCVMMCAATGTCATTQITGVWLDELTTGSTFDLAGSEEAARKAALAVEARRRARAFAPAPRVLVRQPQVMHGRHQLAPLARSSC